MRLLLLAVTGLLLTSSLSAQTLIGRITNTKGQDIPNATFFIRETSHGIMANENGEFRIKLEKGDYTCEISSLGFEKKIMTITVPEEGLTLSINLTEKVYSLREVTVTPGKEDPAYRIMRNVIARAPYHLHQVKSYESDVYMKGSFKIDKVPALIKSQIDKETKDMIGKLLLYESQSKVKYSEPDKYEQHVVAISSSIPEGMNPDDNELLGIMTSNIYSPTMFGGLLAPGSFSIYKFFLEDSYPEGDSYINKIRVSPRKKNGLLVSGWLYIVEDTWTIQQANLSVSQSGISVNFNLTYHEIKKGAFLPAAFDMSMKLSLMGVKGGGQFYASIKYNNLETNDNVVSAKVNNVTNLKPAVSAQNTQTKKQQKNLKKLEELSAKEELSTREAYKMAKLVQETVESDEVKEKKRRLEIRPLDSMIIVTRDSLAFKRDSSFWNNTRTLPLLEEELRSYVQRDSINRGTDSIVSSDSLKNRSPGKWIMGLAFGENINFSKKYYFKYDGILLSCKEYNFVDGFRIGQRLETGINIDNNRVLSISPAIYYTTARKEIDFTIDGSLSYAPLKNGFINVSTGNTIADYAGRNGTGRFGNTLGSLLFAGNTAKFYQKKFASISNKIDIANGLILTTGFKYENRNDLENKASYNFFNKQPNSNRPHGQTEIMPDHKAYVADITIEYTPKHYYSIWKGRKYYNYTSFPTMSLSYKKGFPGGDDKNTSFDNIEATVFQTVKLNLFNNIFYEVNAGTFLSSKQAYLADYKHFRTNEMFLSGKSFSNSFYMDNYIYATKDKWLQAHVAFQSNYLLIKQLPFMQRMLFDEAIHLHTLWTPVINYNEAGYSIGLGGLGRLGVFVGFNKLKYESTGVLITLPIMSLMNK